MSEHPADNERSPFDKKVDSIATVLDEFAPLQVLKAVEQLADDPDSLMHREDVVTAASNVATDEELKHALGRGETPELQTTDSDRSGGQSDE